MKVTKNYVLSGSKKLQISLTVFCETQASPGYEVFIRSFFHYDRDVDFLRGKVLGRPDGFFLGAR